MVTVQEYVNVTMEIFPKLIKTIETEMEKLKKRAETEFKDNPFGAFGLFFELIIKVFGKYEKFYKKIGMNTQEFLAYGQEHKQEVDDYLAQHPEFKEQMEKLATAMKMDKEEKSDSGV